MIKMTITIGEQIFGGKKGIGVGMEVDGLKDASNAEKMACSVLQQGVQQAMQHVTKMGGDGSKMFNVQSDLAVPLIEKLKREGGR